MKSLVKSLVAVATLAVSGYSFAGCPSGTGAIYFQNNTSATVSAQVQDAKTGQGFPHSPAQSVPSNQGVTFCFPQTSDGYQLMQYPASGPNLEYPISESTLQSNNWFMYIYATDSHFQPVGGSIK